MFCYLLLIFWGCVLGAVAGSDLMGHSRPKRYLVFPEGSTFSFAFCMTIKAITPDVDIFTEAVAVAVSYDLPYNGTQLGVSRPLPVLQRSQRAAVYSKLESILDRLGIPGRSCVLRAICEAAQQLCPGDGILTEILRRILLFPEEDPRQEEPTEQWRYLGARRAGLHNYNCPDLYPECPFSFIEMFASLRPAAP